MAEGGEGREEERWMENGKADARNANHPAIVSNR